MSASESALADQKAGRCPFLSDVLHVTKACVKSANSRGVCTISATSNGSRQDWLVCPYRALDDGLLVDMTRRLYNLSADVPVLLRPVPALDDDAERQKIMSALDDSDARVFVYFQEKLGGEIGLPKTPASPDMSFDIAVVELLADGPSTPVVAEPQVRVGRYGVIEMQTTDTHGSYMQAVKALTGALDLHPASFHEQLAANAEWAGRKIEGPNISNVFKRTFYQISVKFQVTSRDTSAGCVLALPKPVWDSWQPFLGAPELHQTPDGTWRLLDDRTATPNNWIYVFDIGDDASPDGGPAPVNVCLVIGTDAPTLSRAAFDVAPARAVEHGAGTDAVVSSIVRRLRAHIPVVLSPE